MEAETMTLAEFMETRSLSLRSIEVPHRPDKSETAPDAWDKKARHYVVVLYAGEPTRWAGGYGRPPGKFGEGAVRHGAERCLVCNWSQGSGIKHEPKLPDVLDSLRSDAETGENCRSFDNFVSEFGYEVESVASYRAAREAWKACKRIARDLRALLGEADYRVLLDSVERL